MTVATIDQPKPLDAGGRVDLLDALRGFALAGILMANLNYWSGWSFMSDEEKVLLAGPAAQRWVDYLHYWLIDGKFYTIFSLLFGIGFALQLHRLQQRSAGGLAIYRRRLAILLLIGMLHMTLLWEGDILLLYAALGFVLLACRQASDRSLLIAAVALVLMPIPGYALVWWAGVPGDLGLYGLGGALWAALGGDPDLSYVESMRLPGASAFFSWTLAGPPYRIGGFLETWRIPKVMAMFLLGLWAGRRLVARQLFENRTLLKQILCWGLVIGLPANAVYGLFGGVFELEGFPGLQATVVYAIGVAPLGLAYAAAFALLWPHIKGWSLWLAAPGRMALTNYLSHSVLGVIIFYGVGFGLAGRLQPVQWYAIGVAIFAAQAVVSVVWLRYFQFGPAEWLWRCLSYRQRFGLRRRVSISSA